MLCLQTNQAQNTNQFLGDKLDRENWPVRNRTKYNYNTSLNRLTSITGANAMSFSYDERGNVTNNGNNDFVYNLAGNMISSTSPAILYEYDGHNRRVKKTEGGQTSYSVYSSAGTLMHKKAGGVSTDYIYAGSLLVAEKTGSTVDYMYTDLLGSPIGGNNGSSYQEHYRPWGEKKESPIQLADDVGYTGHQRDEATNLTYMQARYYDPVVGRFMAVDPIGFTPATPMTFNRYSYAANNPYKYTDPTGMQSCTTPDCGDRYGGGPSGGDGSTIKESTDAIESLNPITNGSLSAVTNPADAKAYYLNLAGGAGLATGLAVDSSRFFLFERSLPNGHVLFRQNGLWLSAHPSIGQTHRVSSLNAGRYLRNTGSTIGYLGIGVSGVSAINNLNRSNYAAASLNVVDAGVGYGMMTGLPGLAFGVSYFAVRTVDDIVRSYREASRPSLMENVK